MWGCASVALQSAAFFVCVLLVYHFSLCVRPAPPRSPRRSVTTSPSMVTTSCLSSRQLANPARASACRVKIRRRTKTRA